MINNQKFVGDLLKLSRVLSLCSCLFREFQLPWSPWTVSNFSLTRGSSGFLFLPPWLRNSLEAVIQAIVGFISFIFHFSYITDLYCLMSVSWKLLFHIACPFFACFKQERYGQSLLPYLSQKWTAFQTAPQIWLDKHSITPGNLSKIWLRVREGNNSASHSMPESHFWWLYHLEISWGSHEWNFTQNESVSTKRTHAHPSSGLLSALCLSWSLFPDHRIWGLCSLPPLSLQRTPLSPPPHPHKHGSEAVGGHTRWSGDSYWAEAMLSEDSGWTGAQEGWLSPLVEIQKCLSLEQSLMTLPYLGHQPIPLSRAVP